MEGAAKAVGGGSGRSIGAVEGVASTGTGARGRGSVALGNPIADPTPPACGIEPGGRGTSIGRLVTAAGAIPAGGGAGIGAGATTAAGGCGLPSRANAGAAPSARLCDHQCEDAVRRPHRTVSLRRRPDGFTAPLTAGPTCWAYFQR